MAIVITFALAFSAVSPGLHAAEQTPRKTELHPEIRGALNALQKAQAYLTLANHDFGGHRADALHAVDEAIKQLKLANQYDKK